MSTRWVGPTDRVVNTGCTLLARLVVPLFNRLAERFGHQYRKWEGSR